MNSVNDTFDTTSKVNLLEHQPSSPSPTQRRNRNIGKIFFCFVIFLILITGSILLYLIHKHNVKSPIQFNSEQVNEAVRIFCSMTFHLPECIKSLSSIAANGRKKIDPDHIFSVSLMLASKEVNNLASVTESLILISTESRSVSTLRQCALLIDDSLDKLDRSLTTSAGFMFFSGHVKVLGNGKIRDVIQWINGSVSDLGSCGDLLAKDESRAVDELRFTVQRAKIYAGNSFDFLQNRRGIITLIESWKEQNAEPVVDYDYLSILLCVFCPQYLVLFFLYFLLLRKY